VKRDEQRSDPCSGYDTCDTVVLILEGETEHSQFHLGSPGPEMMRGVSVLALLLGAGVCCVHPDSAALCLAL